MLFFPFIYRKITMNLIHVQGFGIFSQFNYTSSCSNFVARNRESQKVIKVNDERTGISAFPLENALYVLIKVLN